MAWSNPIAFRPGQVTFWTTVIYLALLIPILVVHNTVPSVPSEKKLPHGVNMTEAWHDLASLTKEFHPYNSRANDRVRDWLLLRTQEILDSNGVSWSSETDEPASASLSEHQATVFNDIVSNITFNETSKPPSYFEGNNVMVYIRGQDDDEGDWWKQPYAEIEHRAKAFGKGGVLVNSHYDSVSTGYGATDDGMGVITCLQLIRYFTVPQNKPRRGIVVLFNNGEEDLLNGARAFGKTPLLPFIHTFLNLEGAGAGGRATVFRATDTEVTNAYRRAPHPFSSVVSSDSFKLGMIRSQTDYVIWEKFGHRGIDMAFYSPRSLYHTNQDDVRHASQESLWHMLSGSLATVSGLSGDTGKTFIGPRPDGRKDMVANGKPTRGVWFDLFGEKLVLFRLRAMFAWSLTILIVSPLALLLITYLVHRSDKNYIFSTYVWIGEEPDREKVSTGGLRGLFRFPLALIVAGGLTVGAALLLRKVNPLIVHSSSYAVWAMSLSLFYFAFWTIMRGADFARPSALHRAYTHFWLFVIGWAALVAATVFEDRFNIASGYIAVFWQSQVFLSALVGALEFFALPKRKTFALEAQDDDEVRDHLHAVPHSDSLIAPSADEAEGESAVRDEEDEEEGPTETTALIGRSNDDNARTTFSTGYRRTLSNMLDPSRRDTEKGPNQPYLHEQNWSGSLPSSAWFLQFLLLGPFTIILSAPLALALSYSINQTGEDGSPLLLPYLLIAVFSILLLLPATPFIHRVTHHVPLFLLLVFAGTLIYNLVAFPFSPANPCKIYFAQELDLDTGATKVVYTGLEQYIRPVISQIPSAAGKHLDCRHGNGSDTLVTCSYDAAELAPQLNPDIAPGIPPQKGYEGLITVNTFAPGNNKATLMIDAVDTRACLLSFKKPVASVHVHGSDKEWDSRYGPVDSRHIDEFMLWRRDWDKTWVVDVEWDDEDSSSSSLLLEGSHEVSGQPSDAMGGSDELKKRVASGLEGFVTCSWSDANTKGVIPAIDEAWQYAPTWVRVTKRRVGLVEGRKSFMV